MKTLILTLTTSSLLALPALTQERDKPAPPKVNLENVEKRLKGAVERGDMTAEQAKAKFAEIKKQLAHRRDAEIKKDRPTPPEKREDIRKHQEEMRKRQEGMRRQAEERKHHEAEVRERLADLRRQIEQKHRDAAERERDTHREMAEREHREHEERARDERMEREHQERERQERREIEERERHEHREHIEREHHERQQHRREIFEGIERSLHEAVEAGLISGHDAQIMMAKLHLAAAKNQKRKER